MELQCQASPAFWQQPEQQPPQCLWGPRKVQTSAIKARNDLVKWRFGLLALAFAFALLWLVRLHPGVSEFFPFLATDGQRKHLALSCLELSNQQVALCLRSVLLLPAKQRLAVGF